MYKTISGARVCSASVVSNAKAVVISDKKGVEVMLLYISQCVLPGIYSY